jgi:hypothetical protein
VKRAWAALGAAAGCVAGGGWLIAATWHLSYGHGLYCAIGVASTVGCDTVPRTPAGRDVAIAVMLTAIPLLATVFALATSGHITGRIREHLETTTHAALADMRRELADLKATAEKTRRSAAAAHRIAADTHEQMTGLRHASSPGAEECEP